MSDRIEYGNLQVAKELDNFLREEVVPGIDVDPDDLLLRKNAEAAE